MNDFPIGVSQPTTDDFYVFAGTETVHAYDSPLEVDAGGPINVSPMPVGYDVASVLGLH